MDFLALRDLLAPLWVLWFCLLFAGTIAWVLRPGSREAGRQDAEIPFRNDPN